LLVVEPGTRYDPATDLVIITGENGPPPTPDTVPGVVNGEARPVPIAMALGRTYRLRLINVDADHRIRFTLFRDSTVARWRAVSRDGADLPPGLAVDQPATLMTGTGQTADFLLVPRERGRWELAIEGPFADVPWRLTLPLQIR
jgi:hypothetical protein